MISLSNSQLHDTNESVLSVLMTNISSGGDYCLKSKIPLCLYSPESRFSGFLSLLVQSRQHRIPRLTLASVKATV